MGEAAHGQVLDVLGDDEVAAAQQGQGLRGPRQGDAGPGAGAQVDVALLAGGGEDVDHVASQGRSDAHPRDRLGHGEHLSAVEHRAQLGQRVARGLLVDDGLLGLRRRDSPG